MRCFPQLSKGNPHSCPWDTACQMLVTGYPDARYWLLDAACRMLDTAYLLLIAHTVASNSFGLCMAFVVKALPAVAKNKKVLVPARTSQQFPHSEIEKLQN